MKVKLASDYGFCFGVRRAISLAVRATRSGQTVYSLGPLIHNRQEVERLERKGIKVVDTLSEVKGGILVIRSHGVEPHVIEEAEKKGLTIVDATCPFVKKVQRLTSSLQRKGFTVIVFGEREHPEVRALASVEVLEDEPAARAMPSLKKAALLSQTTQSVEQFKAIAEILKSKVSGLKIYDTICGATTLRQASARKLAARVDVMLVFGGYHSANTRRLAEICKIAGTQTYHLETADEIKDEWLAGKETVGITAGASTPDWIVKEAMEKLTGKSRLMESKDALQ